MNKAITDGLVFMPTAFGAGLDVWSSEDGTTGSATYQGAANAAIVTGDQDFGTCLEMQKTDVVQKLRYMGQTPILPGCYLRIRARVKAMTGNLPSVRVAGWAGGAGDVHVSGLTETGPATALSGYGAVAEISAIVGTGGRGGVDMPWGLTPIYGHFGLDLIGASGGVVRIEDIVIEDITEAYLRDLMDWVDVRDYGARGDGLSDDHAAFVAADADADGRAILVPEGTYRIGANLSLSAPVRFVGHLVMPVAARLLLLSNYDFPTYAAAFGDEVEGFRKAFQALFYYTDHNVLDLGGRQVHIDAPIVLSDLLPDISSFSNRRVVCNGQFNVTDSTAWASSTVTSVASYAVSQPTVLTGVANVANIPVGARVSGAGVGREVYVRAVNVGAGTVTLSQPLYGGSGTRSYSFTRDRYLFDFSGMARLDRFNFADIEFLLNGRASGILLPPAGEIFQMRDCWMMKPRDRGVTSIGRGCQGLSIDRCHFMSNETETRVQDRTTVAVNVNANDLKIRESRFVRFGLTCIAAGTGHMFTGNHWFQGDDETAGVRGPGLVLTTPNVQTTVTANYIDNASLEWTNEYAPDPDLGVQYSFGGLTVTGNTFVASSALSSFAWFVFKPYGTGHFIHGLTISNNAFRTFACTIDRIDTVDTTFADFNYTRMRNIVVEGNNYSGVTQFVSNPATVEFTQSSAAATWVVDAEPLLPLNGWARNVEGLVAEGAILNASGGRVSEMPYVLVEQGTDNREVHVKWSTAARGTVQVKLRMDNLN
ncbi:glycosyl hydrolase family 28-related protein [Phaeovulum vinaykumarii]|uniref:Pectate lyase superfamily protein n=1 Tax=Phaeovulum vinaykumarii TaxID=407234 RepID=A0A1N7KAX1_9RHOB|nr:glycosyl hydrolase family 28-related protein [Phaeovulum vinaykumarii]SIS58679.1 Pectate lyase superfamily protein [Phaeovulum vinaykumarii]SOB93886.1 pectate lyase-like protein [Phaeovulum vinaykumarii]